MSSVCKHLFKNLAKQRKMYHEEMMNYFLFLKYSQTQLLGTTWDRSILFVINGVHYNRVTVLALNFGKI
jgi:hypothetical protein